ncbi:MAG TPA: DUF3108 domain-containing protein [Puia sp.]|nr:DUF3108 domain-containing protein [Puia sp.]
MRKFLILASFLFISAFDGPHGSGDGCSVQNNSFMGGEYAAYNIYYTLAGVYFEAGTVNFTCRSEQLGNKPVYHITAVGKTIPFYDHLYKVRDKYETYIDTSSLLSYQFSRSVLEANVKKYENIRFNREIQTAITDSGVYKVPACILDVLGAVYYVRNLSVENLHPNDKVDFQLFLENQIYKSYVRYVGKEIITTKYGKFHAIKIKPLLIKGSIFETGEKMTVWVSDDANHIPLRIQASIRIGSVKADLMEFNNLRWPLSSLISK